MLQRISHFWRTLLADCALSSHWFETVVRLSIGGVCAELAASQPTGEIGHPARLSPRPTARDYPLKMSLNFNKRDRDLSLRTLPPLSF